MRSLIIILLFSHSIRLSAQIDTTAVLAEIKNFQDTLNHEYFDEKKSPLEPKQLKRFKGHNFFPVNLKYHVKAKFIREQKDSVFIMKTTTDRKPEYIKYGMAIFELDGESYILNIYQNLALRSQEKYKDYLFLPFKDLTNGKETYGGGRFIDLKIPSEDSIVIDFNKAYNPYCAYNHKYSCPIPPKENHLNLKVSAGVMLFDKSD